MGVTQTIPIVMALAGAPLQPGFIDSLARPGGNVTALSARKRRLAANTCSFSEISFRTLSESQFSHRLRPQTRLVDRSWRTSAWPPLEPAVG
jgi:hypothetical protein